MTGLLRTASLPVRKRRAQLDFALPTINVVLLLILFFLVAGTIIEEEELGIPTPQVFEAPDSRLPRPLLALTVDGVLLLDGVQVEEAGLVDAARRATEATGAPLNVLMPAGSAAGPLLTQISQIGNADIPIRLVTSRTTGDAAETVAP